MPAYHFVAIAKDATKQRGVLEAESEKHLRQQLRDRSLMPVEVRVVQHTQKQGFSFRLMRQGVTTKELAAITRQLATLLTAGLPLEESLQAVAEQADKSRVQGLLLSVRSKVMQGHTFADALGEHPTAFSTLYCATIAAGEKTGHLDKILLRLADYTEQQSTLKQKLQSALIYPSMMVLVAISIVGFLLEYVVPKMVAVYGNLNQALPWLTVVLIALSHVVQAAGLYLLLLLVVAFFAARFAIKKNIKLRVQTHAFFLRLPLLGYALRTINTARFARTLSILSAAGVPMLEAMQVAAKVLTLIPIQRAVTQAVHHIREGASIHLALKQTHFFSPMTIHMIASGEASGQVEAMLTRVADNQESDITRLIDVALALFEPAIILIMGAIVLFIVLAVLLPIFQLNQFTG